MPNLVDLSLFAESPTNDGHFAPVADFGHSYISGPPPAIMHQTVTMKPLPPIPNQKTAALRPDPRSQVASTSRCILDRMRRLRLDTAVAAAPDAVARPQRTKPTLQQRRRNPEANTPSLTIPTGRPPAQGRTASAIEGQHTQAPMIWLVEEQIWLVADNVERDRELYGFYAPAPSSDPGPWQGAPGLHGPAVESPPAYSSSSASPPDSSDFSPVRSQFLSLMESQRQSHVQTGLSPSDGYHVPPIRDDKAMSPLFQQAISGVDYLPTFSHGAPERRRQRSMERRETMPSEECVSPLSPEMDACPWRMQRAASSRV